MIYMNVAKCMPWKIYFFLLDILRAAGHAGQLLSKAIDSTAEIVPCAEPMAFGIPLS
jgi:hypothetical protein